MNLIKNLLFIAFLFPSVAISGGDEEIVALLEKLKIGSARSEDGDDDLPRYIVVILSRDLYDGEDVESDGESDDEFPNDLLAANENLYDQNRVSEGAFSLYEQKPATIEEVPAGPQVSQRIRNMAIKLATEAFGRRAAESIEQAQARMKIVVLCNRVNSMSRSRRYQRNDAPTAPVHIPTVSGAHIEVSELHYHLTPQWRERRAGNVMVLTPLERVARYFRALKRFEQRRGVDINLDESGARRFRKFFEDNIRSVVPFHSLRNAVKNHPLTIQGFVQFYAENADAPIYLAFFDDDFESLRPEGLGLFGVYDDFVHGNMLAGQPIPSILSTGYRFASSHDIAVIASEIDRLVRSATSRVIPNAPCYPEPNFLILAHQPQNPRRPRVVEADFDTTQDAKTKTESRSFIKEAYLKGDAQPQTTYFLPFFPMHTTTPPRVNVAGLSAQFSEDGRLENWGEGEIKFLRTMSQSHLTPRDWAQGVIGALPLSNQLPPQNFGFAEGVPPFRSTRGKTIFNIAVSAVSRMFSAYLPIASAFTNQLLTAASNKQEFRNLLLASLIAYGPKSAILRPAEQTTDTTAYGNYLRAVQSTNNMIALRLMLAGIFAAGEISARQIENAAISAGQAVRDGILYYFGFESSSDSLRSARYSAPLFLCDQMAYLYTDQDMRNLLMLTLGVDDQGEDPNEVLDLGQGRYLFPPIGAVGAQTPVQVLHENLFNHLLQNPEDQIIAVPFHLGAHWVGVVLRVETLKDGTRQLRVKYIDSSEPDDVIIQEVHNAVVEVAQAIFPNAQVDLEVIQKRTQTDSTACGPITVENLADELVQNRPIAPAIMTPELTLELRQAHIGLLNDANLELENDGPLLLKKKTDE